MKTFSPLERIVVGYYRVSTARQGLSGLGLDAQRTAVHEYLKTGNWHLAGEFTEIKSGRRNDRPQLVAALNLCRMRMAKLDRLARNVAFVAALLESKVKFVAADMPEADQAFLQMVSVFAEWEARKISERTRAALAAAKARGRMLGWAIPARKAEQKLASQQGASENRAGAIQFSLNVAPVIGVGELE